MLDPSTEEVVAVVVPDSVLGVTALVALVLSGVLHASVRVWAAGSRWTTARSPRACSGRSW
ncbi:hypothetical protein C5C36_04360 [Rathayibacter sp. AY1G1]|jgi:hypothetical protein|nr:hypothetical protein C5B98_11985 [Rathayibacter sp. AY1A5]PPF26385.1 hypothetical protein C5C54_13310 [Rathayibacter sp. AY1F2]PPF49816.1 hypothetical protein C5E14_02910 [Rathayibacter sp. AY1A1]PPF73123.1 hypothetical protein C5C46_04245 [Rathayibacter sp. AY1E6]PPG13529.1 hypothetical protein C5C74_14840 [Rathayibacter sp. AY1E8]PPG44049.1 hypothetical protein C5C30_03685 [Rathayibacter sp. AY2B5]PPH03214.1 hypothetical protein C5C32_01440 [Rathayibacter sp. AY1G9]PPH05410.1 hypothetic